MRIGQSIRSKLILLMFALLLGSAQFAAAESSYGDWYQPWPQDYPALLARMKTIDNQYRKSRHLSYFDLKNASNQTVFFVLTVTGDNGTSRKWNFSLNPGSDYEFSIDAGRISDVSIGSVRYGG
jgi:hypothetical protein